MHGKANGQPVKLESVATLRTDWAPPPGDWPTATAPAANTPAPSLPLSDLGKMSVCATPVKRQEFDHNQPLGRHLTYWKDQHYHIQPTQDKMPYETAALSLCTAHSGRMEYVIHSRCNHTFVVRHLVMSSPDWWHLTCFCAAARQFVIQDNILQ